MSRTERLVARGGRVLVWGVLAALLLLGGVASASRLPQADERPREVLASGGTNITANSITLRGTLGQPFVAVSAQGSVRLSQGFWHGGEVVNSIYLPLLLKN